MLPGGTNEPSSRSQMSKNRSNRQLLKRYRIWIILVILIVLASFISSGYFIHPSNIVNMLFLAAPIGIAAIGQTVVMLTAGIDLSVASTWIFASVVGATLAAHGHSAFVSLLGALLVGLVCGAVNGFLVSYLKISALIATLGMLSMAEGIARIYTNNVPILSMPAGFQQLGNFSIGPIPGQTIIWLVVLLIVGFIMRKTVLGRTIFAAGGNPVAARYSGLSVGFGLFTVYVISGILAALAGTLQSAYLNIAVPNADLNTLFDVIAGAVVGGTSLFGGEGSLLNTVAGVMVIVVIENVLRILGVSPLVFQAVVGTVIVLAVYLNVGFGKGSQEERVHHKGI